MKPITLTLAAITMIALPFTVTANNQDYNDPTLGLVPEEIIITEESKEECEYGYGPVGNECYIPEEKPVEEYILVVDEETTECEHGYEPGTVECYVPEEVTKTVEASVDETTTEEVPVETVEAVVVETEEVVATPVVTENPDYTLAKKLTSKRKAKKGSTVKYKLTLTNTGDVDLHDVQLADKYPNGKLDVASASIAPEDMNDDGELNWTIEEVAVGETVNIKVEFTVAKVGKTKKKRRVKNVLRLDSATTEYGSAVESGSVYNKALRIKKYTNKVYQCSDVDFSIDMVTGTGRLHTRFSPYVTETEIAKNTIELSFDDSGNYEDNDYNDFSVVVTKDCEHNTYTVIPKSIDAAQDHQITFKLFVDEQPVATKAIYNSSANAVANYNVKTINFADQLTQRARMNTQCKRASQFTSVTDASATAYTDQLNRTHIFFDNDTYVIVENNCKYNTFNYYLATGEATTDITTKVTKGNKVVKKKSLFTTTRQMSVKYNR